MGDTLNTLYEIDNIEITRIIECDSSDLAKRIQVKRNDLTIISQNIRSIYCNFDSFLTTLSSLAFETDVIILTECRLSAYKQIPQLNNYHSYTSTNHLNQNDGVVVYVKNTLKCKAREVKLTHASCLQLDILNFIILCIYRSPSNVNTDNFLESFGKQLDTLPVQKNIIIAGDININIRPKDTEPSQERKNRLNYLNMLSAYGILPGHTQPTRENNCLDHFMLKFNKNKLTAAVGILHTTVTDHYTTFLCVSKIKNIQFAPKMRKSVSYETALKYLQEHNIAELLFCDDPIALTNLLLHKLSESIKISTDIVKIPCHKRIIKPWITPGILRCIHNRNKMQKSLKNEPHNEVLKITYIRYRNYCNNLIKKLKRKYHKELLAKTVNNNKLLWINIKTITYSSKYKNENGELLNLKSSPMDSVNFINDFFVSIGEQLARNIQLNSNLPSSTGKLSNQPNSFVLYETDCNEVKAILADLKTSSAPGWDNLTTGFLKYISREAVPIITHLANLCFRTGLFPAPLKQSIITPVHKGGNRDDVNNYRPISVLPTISKIIEKLINNRLLKYFNKFDLLSHSQYGFRQGLSTEDAVTALTTQVVDSLDNGNKCITIFLDLKKAFDTVSVSILVSKLEREFGIRGIPLDLLRNYLSDRKQRVRIGDCISEDAQVSFGVPQGSVLGPTLFLTYINDLCNLRIKNAKIFSYADDTAVVFSGKSWKEVKVYAELGMTVIAKWLKNNLLTLNTSKTNFICFCINNRTQPDEQFKLKIHQCDNINNLNCKCPKIDKVTLTKYLGVIVDQRLSWYQHLEQVSNRVRKLSWLFNSLRHVVPKTLYTRHNSPRNLLNEIYIALVQSVLTYCIPVWGGASKSKFIDVERAQRALIKIMYFKKMRFHTGELYQISDLLSVRKLYILHTILKTHKSVPVDSSKLTKRRKDNIIQIPQSRTRFASIQLLERSAQLYNRINREIHIYTKQYHDCKKSLINWIKPLNYEETEALFTHVS